LRVDKLDLDVLLVDAWELAVEFVGGFDFLDVELGLEGLQSGAVATTSVVAVEFIEEAEEGCEGWLLDQGGEG